MGTEGQKVHATITLPGRPITKKNSSQIVHTGGRPIIVPSKQYKAYEKAAGPLLKMVHPRGICEPVTVTCLYYMPDHRRVDLVNLLEGTCDILVKFGVLADDNSQIVVSHDGSRVLYDKANPRVEITIARAQPEKV